MAKRTDSDTEDMIDASVRDSMDFGVKADLDEQLKGLKNQKQQYFDRLIGSLRTKLNKANKHLDIVVDMKATLAIMKEKSKDECLVEFERMVSSLDQVKLKCEPSYRNCEIRIDDVIKMARSDRDQLAQKLSGGNLTKLQEQIDAPFRKLACYTIYMARGDPMIDEEADKEGP